MQRMKQMFDILQNATKDITLSKEEKFQMRESLIEYLTYMPSYRHTFQKETYEKDRFGFSRMKAFPSFFRTRHLRGALLIALVVTSGTMSVTTAATSALPGDLLYPIKIRVNEEVRTVFMSSNEARVSWEQERTEMRLREAGTLVANGRLDDKAQEVLQKQIAIHTDTFIAQVQATAVHDPILATEMSDDFADSMEENEALLTRLIVEKNETVPPETRAFVQNVHTATRQAVSLRNTTEQGATNEMDFATTTTPEITATNTSETNADGIATEDFATPTVETRATQTDYVSKIDVRAIHRAKKRAEDRYQETILLVEKMETDDTLHESTNTQIASAKALMESGTHALERADSIGAYTAYREASMRLQKVVRALHATQLFDVRIVDDVLPDVPSDTTEESDPSSDKTDTNETALLYKETGIIIDDAKKMLSSHEEHGTEPVEQVRDYIKTALAYQLQAEIAIALSDVESAYAHTQNAQKYAKESLNLLTAMPQQPENIPPHNIDNVVVEETEESDVSEELPTGVSHTFFDGIHYATGTLQKTFTCTRIESNLVQQHDDPLQLQVVLSTFDVFDENGYCDGTQKNTLAFFATSTAPAEAVISEVTLNEKPILWYNVDDALLEIDDMHTATSNDEVFLPAEDATIFQKAVDTTRALFR